MDVRRWFLFGSVLAVGVLGASTGCINLGTRNIQDNPATNSRIQALETRVSTLERMLSPAGVQSTATITD
jgi:hypothetical protein